MEFQGGQQHLIFSLYTKIAPVLVPVDFAGMSKVCGKSGSKCRQRPVSREILYVDLHCESGRVTHNDFSLYYPSSE